MKSNITFEQFLKHSYKRCKYKKGYESFEKFRDSKVKSFGIFTEWLTVNKDTTPGMRFIISLAKTYLIHARRKLADIPAILVYIEHHFNIKIPVVEGILTEGFWINRLGKFEPQH